MPGQDSREQRLPTLRLHYHGIQRRMPVTKPVVFISSTSADLRLHRDAAARAARQAGFEPDIMEDFEAQSLKPPYPACMDKVAECDVLVVIVGAQRLAAFLGGVEQAALPDQRGHQVSVVVLVLPPQLLRRGGEQSGPIRKNRNAVAGLYRHRNARAHERNQFAAAQGGGKGVWNARQVLRFYTSAGSGFALAKLLYGV